MPKYTISVEKLLRETDRRRAGLPPDDVCAASGCDRKRNPGKCKFCSKHHPAHKDGDAEGRLS